MPLLAETALTVRRPLGLAFSERMEGTLLQGDQSLPFSFAIRAHARSLWQFFTDGMMDVEGEVTIGAQTMPCKGRLRMPVRQLRVDLQLDFERDGISHHYVAMKRVTLWRFLRNITVFNGTVESARGRVGEAATYFNLRRDFFALLLSISPRR